MDFEAQRRQVALALTRVEGSVERLAAALAHRPVWVRVQDAASDIEAIKLACAAYQGITYGMEDSVGTSVVCLGVIGVSTDIFRAAQAVNAAKGAFKEVCAPLQRLRIRVPVKDAKQPTKAIAAIRVILRSLQRSDLNLLAAYRKIPLLDSTPVAVAYTRANTRAVYRTSVEDVYGLLINSEGKAAAADRARLSALTHRELHLALVRDRYQNVRANVVYSHLDRRGRGRVQISAEVPLMYAIGRKSLHPTVRFPEPLSDLSSIPQRVRTSKLERLPFLESLPVYRYLAKQHKA